MSAAGLALQEAVFALLSGDAELSALLGGPHVYDGAPRNAAPPYVHLGETTQRDWSTSTEAGAEIAFALVVWSTALGKSEALAIAGRLDALLDDAPLTIAGWRLVNLRHVATETSRDAGLKGRRAVVRFRAVLEPM
jgi:hypothetical protein